MIQKKIQNKKSLRKNFETRKSIKNPNGQFFELMLNVVDDGKEKKIHPSNKHQHSDVVGSYY